MKRFIHQPGLAGLWLLLALAACNAGEPHVPSLHDVNTQLAFTCAYEKDHLPALYPRLVAHWLDHQQRLEPVGCLPGSQV